MMISIRPGGESDIEAILGFDEVARVDARRVEAIRRWVATGQCFVAEADNQVAGYAALEHSFYDNGFIAMLYVDAGRRRRGVGAALMRRLEPLCRAPKLFTSTNLSNLPMQALLAKLGYALSGVIHNLDEGDPELVYFKRVTAWPVLPATPRPG